MQERCDASRHVRLIDAIVCGQGRPGNVQQVVRRSWMRCLWDYALDPMRPKQPPVVEQSELQARRERLGALYSIAHGQMLALAARLERADVGVVLTDRDGVIAGYVGHDGFAEAAQTFGLREGAVWSEAEQGTNGMGTCLAEGRPMFIDRHDHFLAQNTGLTCAAAPIVDGRGDVAAVLDISGCPSAGRASILALIDWTAENIANRALLSRSRDQFALRFHTTPESVCTPDEGVIVLDDGGKVAGANRQALKLFGCTHHAEVCDRPLEQLFDTTFQHLASAMRGMGMACMPVRSRDQREFSLTVQRPRADSRAGSSARVLFGSPGERLANRPRSAKGNVCDDDSPTGPLDAIEFGDPVMARNASVLRRVLDSDLPILLLGETGTGKGHLAKAIHKASPRAGRDFVTVNCAAIPESLIESELFGYQAGAFTGAASGGRAGRIVQADGGTLFLDEIGDMPLPLQVRLLTVIEDQEVVPLGGSQPVAVDVRIISATHRDLVACVHSGQFRDDLYYRINGIALNLPPLRQRADAPELIRRLLEHEAGAHCHVDDVVIGRLASLPWPGNLRQLRNVLRAMVALSDGGCLTVDDIPPDPMGGAISPPRLAGPAAVESGDCQHVLDQAECEALRQVMDRCHWAMTKAAKQLGISRKTLYRKLHKHGLKRPTG